MVAWVFLVHISAMWSFLERFRPLAIRIPINACNSSTVTSIHWVGFGFPSFLFSIYAFSRIFVYSYIMLRILSVIKEFECFHYWRNLQTKIQYVNRNSNLFGKYLSCVFETNTWIYKIVGTSSCRRRSPIWRSKMFQALNLFQFPHRTHQQSLFVLLHCLLRHFHLHRLPHTHNHCHCFLKFHVIHRPINICAPVWSHRQDWNDSLH